MKRIAWRNCAKPQGFMRVINAQEFQPVPDSKTDRQFKFRAKSNGVRYFLLMRE
jgi:hypothetical protein